MRSQFKTHPKLGSVSELYFFNGVAESRYDSVPLLPVLEEKDNLKSPIRPKETLKIINR